MPASGSEKLSVFEDNIIILNDINNPIISKIKKNSAAKKILNKVKHKIYDIDYSSTDSTEDQISNVINDIRNL